MFQARQKSRRHKKEQFSLQAEKSLWAKGYKYVVGLDEAGRGPLAGPVVAAAVILNTKYKILNTKLRDSKKLSPKKREEFYKAIKESPFIKWGIGRVSEKVIDKVNILEATKLAMKRAINKMQNSKYKNQNEKSKFKIDYLILDGKMKLDLSIPQKSIVKADEKVFSCACASILAKVTRDRLMMGYHKKYPKYRFDLHKGYPTEKHIKMLKKCKPCAIHRITFFPVLKSLKHKVSSVKRKAKV